MYDTILFPTDGSDGAAAAMAHARDIAATYGSTLHVLHVVDTRRPHTGMISERHDDPEPGVVADPHDEQTSAMSIETFDPDEFEEHARDLVDSVATALDGDREVVTAVRYGTPHREIMEYVDEHGVDLVILGTHGRTGIDRFMLGSVAERVVRTSPVPVLTVRMDGADAAGHDAGDSAASE